MSDEQSRESTVIPAYPSRPKDQSARDKKLQACLGRVLRGEGVPPFGQNAQELMDCAGNPETGSSQLARVVLRDLGLTSQLLRVVNSSYYNRSGRRILSVPHAISMLGWDTVRTLVAGLRFVETYARRSPGLRELMTFSLLNAANVQQAAIAVGYARPEEAYICGLFRNLGEVLMARYFGREYADVLIAVEKDHLPLRSAARRVFGFEFDDIGPGIAEFWNLPEQVRMCTGGGRGAMSVDEQCLASLTNFGHELTASLYRYHDIAGNRVPKRVTTPTGRAYNMTAHDLDRITDRAIIDTRHTLNVLQMPAAALAFEAQAEQARAVLGAPPEQAISACDLDEVEAALEIAAARLAADDFEAGGFIHDLLEVLTGSGAFDRSLFALMSEDGRSVRGRLGGGSEAGVALTAFRFSLEQGDPLLHACIERKQDLWINREIDPRFEASRVFAAFAPEHAVVFPIVVDDVVAAVLYADRKSGAPANELRAPVDRMRDLIAAALARTRSGASQPVHV